jgi:membrane dipeptidase
VTAPIPVFDGHNDALLRLHLQKEGDPVAGFLAGTAGGHIDLPKAREGGLAGGLFAVFCPSPEKLDFGAFAAGGEVPMPPPLPMDMARQSATRMISLLFQLERASGGQVSVCRSAAEVRAAMSRHALATVLHIEGVECIDGDLDFLEVLYAAGLRSLGPVWSRHNIFGHGVPFRFPGSPDTGPGLTEAGRRLVSACNRLGVLVDLSHLNERGFWDVAGLSSAPLVATHSNAHALCPTPRNLTDDQLRAIGETGGMAGLNFATGFLRPDGRMDAATDIDLMLRHLDHMIEMAGEDHVGLGSDFDGAVIPETIRSAAGLPRLVHAMEQRGYGRPLIEKLAHANYPCWNAPSADGLPMSL